MEDKGAIYKNSDYTEIKNGEFRIIGKVLEKVPVGEKVLHLKIGLCNSNII